MEKKEIFAVFKYAGAFIAWMIGSGFATGQEILQFFSSYGEKCIWILLVNFVGFAVLGVLLVLGGYKNRGEENFSHYEYYCGKFLGKIYAVVVPVMLILIMAVLFSAAGATLEQICGLNPVLGSILMAAAILTVYLIGFEKMVKVVSSVSPVVILFVVFVAGWTVLRDFSGWENFGAQSEALLPFQSSPHWLLSAILYLSLNFLSGSVYYTELGRTAKSRRSVTLGTLLGAVVLIFTIGMMTFAILQNGNGVAAVSVPTLYLAEKISRLFGSAYSVVLLLGMFAACSTMLWSFCSGFYKENKRKNKIFSVCAVTACLLLGFVPFGKLVSVVYPMIGYFGLLFIAGVLIRPFRKNRSGL